MLLFLLPLVLYCLLIFWLSSAPRHVPGPEFPLRDKLMHFMAFGGVGVLAFRATRLLPLASPGFCWLLAAGYAVLFGLSDELHQLGVPGRHADPMDLLADAAGALFWTTLYMQARRSGLLSHPLL